MASSAPRARDSSTRPVGAPAGAPYLFLHGPCQQPFGFRPMAVPHVTSPSGGNSFAYECPSGKAFARGGSDHRVGLG